MLPEVSYLKNKLLSSFIVEVKIDKSYQPTFDHTNLEKLREKLNIRIKGDKEYCDCSFSVKYELRHTSFVPLVFTLYWVSPRGFSYYVKYDIDEDSNTKISDDSVVGYIMDAVVSTSVKNWKNIYYSRIY